MEQLNAQQWKEKLDASSGGVIVDVRTPVEWEEGIIPNAVLNNIHEQQGFMDYVESLDKEKEYFIYCRSGARSGNACAYMDSLGFTNTYNLTGGIMNWPFEKA
ncbi:MAG TPA: rhodanese-like domain-containing protein [Flavobacteriales bacterium]|nr:rhodanese-like domain-containing protein [Flavobacteriales bacterium]|tara:strand:+ start:24356 stop:24664 length:309 start_codon:yes stop_codon:yes gene_type:complete